MPGFAATRPSATVPELARVIRRSILSFLYRSERVVEGPVLQPYHRVQEIVTRSLADLGVDASLVGLDAAWTSVDEVTARPPREKGQVVTDDGDGGTKLAEFLIARKFV